MCRRYLMPNGHLPFVFPTLVTILLVSGHSVHLSSRVVSTKYGQVRGMILEPNSRHLEPVEGFLGIPYAAPPVGSLRFMPPRGALPWQGTKMAHTFPPVCPQKLPDISTQQSALRHMSLGQYRFLHRVSSRLSNQSEDCLYLNIYAPISVGVRQTNKNHPVLIFVHGESFEWGSGNMYDGTVLASYGNIIVVTFNYRLGILGFLRPGIRKNTVSNFGLFDQVAALQWIQENISEFGGDPSRVTVMGHNTGAACVGLLLTSPLAQGYQGGKGLFRRVILMSGNSLTPWSLSRDSYGVTLQAARVLGCRASEFSDEMGSCLRKKTLEELMEIEVHAPRFTTPFGPIVDEVLIPMEPEKGLHLHSDMLKKYDILTGVVSSESFPLFGSHDLQYGFSGSDSDAIIETFISNTFLTKPKDIFETVRNVYTDWHNPHNDRIAFLNRVLEILDDGRTVAPVFKLADMQAARSKKVYLYVFSHHTTTSDFQEGFGAIHGQELPYIFGYPLLDKGEDPYPYEFVREEMLLSEIVMTTWSNFITNGDPNFPQRNYIYLGTKERMTPRDLLWPKYDTTRKLFMSFDLSPSVKSHYKANESAIWNNLIPKLLESSPKLSQENIHQTPNRFRTTAGPQRPPRVFGEVNNRPPVNIPVTQHPLTTLSPFEIIRQKNAEMGTLDYNEEDGEHTEAEGSQDDERSPQSEIRDNEKDNVYEASPLGATIATGVCLLLLNICVFVGLYYQRDRLKKKERIIQKKYEQYVSLIELGGPKVSDNSLPGPKSAVSKVCNEVGKTKRKEDTKKEPKGIKRTKATVEGNYSKSINKKPILRKQSGLDEESSRMNTSEEKIYQSLPARSTKSLTSKSTSEQRNIGVKHDGNKSSSLKRFASSNSSLNRPKLPEKFMTAPRMASKGKNSAPRRSSASTLPMSKSKSSNSLSKGSFGFEGKLDRVDTQSQTDLSGFDPDYEKFMSGELKLKVKEPSPEKVYIEMRPVSRKLKSKKKSVPTPTEKTKDSFFNRLGLFKKKKPSADVPKKKSISSGGYDLVSFPLSPVSSHGSKSQSFHDEKNSKEVKPQVKPSVTTAPSAKPKGLTSPVQMADSGVQSAQPSIPPDSRNKGVLPTVHEGYTAKIQVLPPTLQRRRNEAHAKLDGVSSISDLSHTTFSSGDTSPLSDDEEESSLEGSNTGTVKRISRTQTILLQPSKPFPNKNSQVT